MELTGPWISLHMVPVCLRVSRVVLKTPNLHLTINLKSLNLGAGDGFNNDELYLIILRVTFWLTTFVYAGPK